MDFFRCGGINPPYFIRKFLIISNLEPSLPFIRCPRLQKQVQVLDVLFSQFISRICNNIVNGSEMICSLDYIVNIY